MSSWLPSLALRGLLPAALLLISPANKPLPSHQSMPDVGGHKLFVAESGSGAPAVIFESGLGEDVSTWDDVQPQIAQFAHTVTYDRAGLGKSEPSDKPKSVASMVSELHTLLHTLQIQPPYILVGHSLGGALVEYYASTYPNEIAGLVLVDPEDGRLIDRLHQKMTAEEWNARQEAVNRSLPNFSPAQKAELDTLVASGKIFAESAPVPNVPVVLLTGTKKDPQFPGNPLEQDLKLELQNETLATLPQSRHILVPESRHYIQNEAPSLVIEAVRSLSLQLSRPTRP